MPNQAMSGVRLQDDIPLAYEQMKIKKTNRFIQMKLTDDNTEIQIEKSAPTSATYDDFVQQLPKDDCRYAIVDYDRFKGKDTGSKDLLLFIVWCPDNAPVKKKMLYASSKDAVKSACQGVQAEIQANDFDEVSEEYIAEKTKGKK